MSGGDGADRPPIRWKPMLVTGAIAAAVTVVLVFVIGAAFGPPHGDSQYWTRLGRATGQLAGFVFIAGMVGARLMQRGRRRLGWTFVLLGPIGALGVAVAIAIHNAG